MDFRILLKILRASDNNPKFIIFMNFVQNFKTNFHYAFRALTACNKSYRIYIADSSMDDNTVLLTLSTVFQFDRWKFLFFLVYWQKLHYAIRGRTPNIQLFFFLFAFPINIIWDQTATKKSWKKRFLKWVYSG